MTFARFVLQFTTEDSAYGDLARELATDPYTTPAMGYSALRERISSSGASETVLTLLDELWAQYQRRSAQ